MNTCIESVLVEMGWIVVDVYDVDVDPGVAGLHHRLPLFPVVVENLIQAVQFS